MSIAGVKTVVSAFSDARSDYDMSRASRFIRRRTGVAPTGSGEDWNYRAEIKYYQDIEQARDMDRNDGLVGCLADRRVDNIVQQGFTLDTKTGDKSLDLDLWQRWQAFASDPEACDIAGEMTFHEMERHVCRSESIDGDIVGLGTEDGPLQIHEGHAIQTSSKVENTFLGVTRDKYGRREQYHFRYDLNEFGQKSESEPIDVRNSEGVRQLFHVYNPKRVSATRGVTQLAPVFSLSGMLEDINFAKLVQQQIVSCFAILAEKAVGSNGNLPNVDGRSQFGEPSTENTGSDTRQLEGISPGMFYRGKEGEKLTGFSPNVPNSEYFQQVKLILQIVGVNFGLPLCLVLMDGSETNFSGWRGAVDEARKGFVADQLNLVRRWHSPVYRWWLHREMAMEPILQRAAERKGIDIFGHTWQLPTWSYIEPVADAEGDTAQLRNALTSPRRMHAARGKDWETIAEEIIDDNVYAIEKAQAKADKHNQKFPQAPPLSWRDLIPLPMPEGQTMALQDPAAVAAQEEKTDAPPVKPVARRKKKAVAANDGKWRSTDDGGKIFIPDGGDPKFGGPDGPAIKKEGGSKPPATTTHNIKLPKRRSSLTGDQATSALKGMGITPGKAETKLNPLTKKFETSRELTMPDGTKVRKTADEITKMVYEGADDFVPKKKGVKAADDGEWRTTRDGGKIFIGPGGDPKFGGPEGPDVKEGGGGSKSEDRRFPGRPAVGDEVDKKQTKIGPAKIVVTKSEDKTTDFGEKNGTVVDDAVQMEVRVGSKVIKTTKTGTTAEAEREADKILKKVVENAEKVGQPSSTQSVSHAGKDVEIKIVHDGYGGFHGQLTTQLDNGSKLYSSGSGSTQFNEPNFEQNHKEGEFKSEKQAAAALQKRAEKFAEFATKADDERRDALTTTTDPDEEDSDEGGIPHT